MKNSCDCIFYLFCCSRTDGNDLYWISANLLLLFYQTMSMLPFATRTDIIDAFKMSDTRLSDVDPSWPLYLQSMMRQVCGLSLELSGSQMYVPRLGTRTTSRQQQKGWSTARRQKAPTPQNSPRGAGAGLSTGTLGGLGGGVDCG
jgi:hypothetical protein